MAETVGRSVLAHFGSASIEADLTIEIFALA
jgi:hypothetical protein